MALRNKSVEPPKASRYITKPDMIGAAALMQGYPALEGLGITRIKNQMVDPIPKMINTSLVWLSDLKNVLNRSIMAIGLGFVEDHFFCPHQIPGGLFNQSDQVYSFW